MHMHSFEKTCMCVFSAFVILRNHFTTLYIIATKLVQQAGAELCQAQVKLEVIVYIVEEAWS